MKSDVFVFGSQLPSKNERKLGKVLGFRSDQWHRMASVVNLQWSRQEIVIIDELDGWHVHGNWPTRVNGDWWLIRSRAMLWIKFQLIEGSIGFSFNSSITLCFFFHNLCSAAEYPNREHDKKFRLNSSTKNHTTHVTTIFTRISILPRILLALTSEMRLMEIICNRDLVNSFWLLIKWDSGVNCFVYQFERVKQSQLHYFILCN